MYLKSSFSGYLIECGCDEVGRGCIAGPLYAAAVILPCDYCNSEINDSKQLSRAKREKLRHIIEKEAVAFSVAEISAQVIDEINILNASFLGMNKAVKQLSVTPELLLIDGNRFKTQLAIPYHCIIKGDTQYLSIAAASILAKTYRDEWMEKLHADYPQYDWAQNKGYPTSMHQEAVLKYGRSPLHRKSFQLKNQLKLDL
ncbi:MAG: ribonuclease HII [Bacteroidales bacterium]